MDKKSSSFIIHNSAFRWRARLLRAAFHLLYNQFAWAYDWVSATFFGCQWRRWQRLTLAALPARPGAPVLELGFGTGDLQLDLLHAGYRPVGIDLSAAMLRQARRKARRIQRSLTSPSALRIPHSALRIRLVRARTQALPFAPATFAAVVSTFPSEYIVDPRTVAEIARVLRPGGRLVVVPGATLLPTTPANRLLAAVAALVYGDPPRATAHVEQALAAAFPTLRPLLTAHGFTVTARLARLPTSLALLITADKNRGTT